jgi:hypothetical protein
LTVEIRILNIDFDFDRLCCCCCCAAGDTVKAIIEVGDRVDEGFRDLRLRITQLQTLLNQRACENANQLTAVHITVNHIQRMLQVPEGLRPGEGLGAARGAWQPEEQAGRRMSHTQCQTHAVWLSAYAIVTSECIYQSCETLV